MPASKKSTRLNVRIREADGMLIREAAAAVGESVTDYVTTSAVERAYTILADQRRFILSEEQWSAFVEGFEREPRVIPEVVELFSKPSLLDET